MKNPSNQRFGLLDGKPVLHLAIGFFRSQLDANNFHSGSFYCLSTCQMSRLFYKACEGFHSIRSFFQIGLICQDDLGATLRGGIEEARPKTSC